MTGIVCARVQHHRMILRACIYPSNSSYSFRVPSFVCLTLSFVSALGILTELRSPPTHIAEFLCSLDANVYGIDFVSFIIKNYDTKEVIFKVDRGDSAAAPSRALADLRLSGDFDMDSLRRIDYTFDADVLSLPRVATFLKFVVGDDEVHKFRMIERHYFKNKLIKR